MKTEALEALISERREIEFTYKGKRFSITYYNDDRKKCISICEFYKEPVDVATVQEAIKVRIAGKTIEEIFAYLPDTSIDVY